MDITPTTITLVFFLLFAGWAAGLATAVIIKKLHRSLQFDPVDYVQPPLSRQCPDPAGERRVFSETPNTSYPTPDMGDASTSGYFTVDEGRDFQPEDNP